jgi:hypothetical protein
MTDNMTVTNKEPDEPVTYYDQETLMNISVGARRLAGLFLVLLLIVASIIGIGV